MSQQGIVFDQASVSQLQRNLSLLPRRVGIKHIRIGLNAWGGVVKAVAKPLALKRSGLLRRSLIVKVKIPDASFNTAHHGKPAYVLVGPGRNVVSERIQGVTKRGKLVTKTRVVRALNAKQIGTAKRATRYAHLVEKRQPFIAVAQKAGETTGMEKLRQKLEQGIAQEAAALAK